MKYHHLYSDDSGESHWREVEVQLAERVFAPPAQHILVSDPAAAKTLIFLSLQVGWDEPPHPTPGPQTLICLAGAVRVTASDGDVRDIKRGDVWRMEDLSGKGHHTRVMGDENFDAAIVQFA